MYKIDINSDIGEGFGIYSFGNDENIIPMITSANIACGFHAGDHNQMHKTVSTCLAHGVAVGAHPGYPDLQGFGRRCLKMNTGEIRNMILYQVGALWAITKSLGGIVEHVKPHGALYNAAVKDIEIATAIVDAVDGLDGPALVCLAGSTLASVGRERGIKLIQEGFADRAYTDEGALLGREYEGAIIDNPDIAAQRALEMVKGKIIACSGAEIKVRIDTICVHGDSQKTLEIIKHIRTVLQDNGVVLCKPSLWL